ncbi:uncharacterized protein LOC130636126 [Hydractinia symbiolongicarpus]|nr:uncharacterized protein LOC130636126 [Hydractinia symbiolongicarpus]
MDSTEHTDVPQQENDYSSKVSKFETPVIITANHNIHTYRNSLKESQISLRVKLKEFYNLTYLVKDEELLRSYTTEITALLNSAKTTLQTAQKANLIQSSPNLKRRASASISRPSIAPKKFKKSFSINKKLPYSHRIGQRAKMMRQLYRAKIFITDKNTVGVKTTVVCDLQDRAVHDEQVTAGSTDHDLVETHFVPPNRNRRERCRMSARMSEEIKNDILNGHRLRDDAINLCQKILKLQFPLVNGFEDTDSGEKGWFSHHKENFAQILFHADHWTAVFSLDDKEIYYCDSLAGRIAEAVWKQIADIAFTSESTLSVNISPVHQQKNSIDCGVFAVAHVHGFLQ